MAQGHAEIASDVEQLSGRMRELEQRVSALESQREKLTSVGADPIAVSSPRLPSPPQPQVFPSLNLPLAAVPALGKAVLGIAGAYLLRAIFESGRVPQWPVLVIAVLYACAWLVWAVKTHATNHFASVTYGITAALILSPLLWEGTVRFHILPPALTAIVLFAFVALAMAAAWRQNLQAIPWVATFAAVVTALGLIVATHELVALTTALLAVALITEVTTCLGHRSGVRVVSAIAVDFTVWLVAYIATSEGGTPAGYPAVSSPVITTLCVSLLAIYIVSIGVRGFGLRNRLGLFDGAQGAAAFVVGAWGWLRVSHGASAPLLGVLFLLLAAACYWGALSRFAADADTRNRRWCASFAAALLLAGNVMLFALDRQEILPCLAAVAAAFLYARTRKLSLGFHASLYLAAAAIVSPLFSYTGSALAGTVPLNADWRIWVIALTALLCYAVGSRVSGGERWRSWLRIVPALLLSVVAADLAVVGAARIASGHVALTPPRLAVVRTVVTCLLALALSFLSSIWKHVELRWVAYAAVAFGTLKLLLEDLRLGEAGSLVVSLLFYGLILILIPRLTRPQKTGA